MAYKQPEHIDEVNAKSGTTVRGMKSVLGLSVGAAVVLLAIVLLFFIFQNKKHQAFPPNPAFPTGRLYYFILPKTNIRKATAQLTHFSTISATAPSIL